MFLIAHRGNLDGPNPKKENDPDYIQTAINLGFDCEVDLWLTNRLYLGHEGMSYPIDDNWLKERSDRLWIHCKNIEAFCWMNSQYHVNYNYFWHQEDQYTLTSRHWIWAYPGQPVKEGSRSVAVMPEVDTPKKLDNYMGICTDYVTEYSKLI